MPITPPKNTAPSPVEKGVTQAVRSVPGVAELTVKQRAQLHPICVLRAKPTSSFGTIGQAQTHKGADTHTYLYGQRAELEAGKASVVETDHCYRRWYTGHHEKNQGHWLLSL